MKSKTSAAKAGYSFFLDSMAPSQTGENGSVVPRRLHRIEDSSLATNIQPKIDMPKAKSARPPNIGHA
jgi:hypothetical protein